MLHACNYSGLQAAVGEKLKLLRLLLQADVYEAIAATASDLMGAMCPRDIAKLVYSLGRVQVGDHAFAAAIKPHILSHLDHFTYNVRSTCVHEGAVSPSALMLGSSAPLERLTNPH